MLSMASMEARQRDCLFLLVFVIDYLFLIHFVLHILTVSSNNIITLPRSPPNRMACT